MEKTGIQEKVSVFKKSVSHCKREEKKIQKELCMKTNGAPSFSHLMQACLL